MRKLFYVLFAFFIANFAYAQTVEFQVNMSIKAKKGTFIPGTDTVKLAGNFNGWTGDSNILDDANSDSIYTTTIDTFAVGDMLSFKFLINSTYENISSNREYTVPSGSSVYSAYFDNDSIYSVPKPISITFQCNMEFEKVSGRFDPANDTVTVRGGFNGWGSNDIMEPGLDPNIYEFTSTDDTVSVGEEIHYKYVYVHGGVVNWESGDDKILTITQEDYDNGFASVLRTFNDLTTSTVTNAPCTIKFVTYMDSAINANTGQPFASIDNVVLAGANPPLHWPDAGWPDSDSNLVYFMYDDGTHGDETAGDMYWTRDITFPIYSALDIEYKHGADWGETGTTGGNDNENSVGTNHHIMLDPHTVSATVIDSFGVMGTHELQDVVLGIKDISSNVPDNYSISQNYPNPFNPSTMIRFSIKETGIVSLKVYNVLGQLVNTLVNEQKSAGTYEYNFDASHLSSGIYFYTIKAGNFTATKKMILMK
jgi:hypothetical protein